MDSLLRAAPEGTPAYGDALFWRGALAETAADAERDYRRVIVEYPLSPYSDDALLSLAELEQARGDRAAAFQHLQRFVREHPASPARARAGLAAARLAFEQHDNERGCAMIADARASAGSADVELRNQIEYYGGHCPTATATAVTATCERHSGRRDHVRRRFNLRERQRRRRARRRARAPEHDDATTSASTHRRGRKALSSDADPSRRSRADATVASAQLSRTLARLRRRARTPKANSPRGIWTIQLAAYNTRADAERLVKKLSARGVKARISGDAKPFRVRLDYYRDAASRRRGGRGAQAARHHRLRDRRAQGEGSDASVSGAVATPLMQQYREIKARHQSAILFFRMGDFYEMFYDDAETAARVLGLTLTSRNNGGAAEVPLAGVPVRAGQEYLRRLVQHGYRVAICEQVEDPRVAKGIVRREVVETVSPGVAFADELLDGARNNFIAAIGSGHPSVAGRAPIGMAAADISTGELRLAVIPLDELEAMLARLAPREVLVPRGDAFHRARCRSTARSSRSASVGSSTSHSAARIWRASSACEDSTGSDWRRRTMRPWARRARCCDT